jgi:steroid 5-alpha reductase family enzyme
MGNRTGLGGLIDRLRFHEASRQGLGLLLVLVCALFPVIGEERLWAGFAIAVFGQLFRIYAAGFIHKNRELATTGAYSLVRHPLYLGNFLIMLGFAIACGNWIVIAIAVAFFLFYYPAAIRYEDSKLEGIFGEAWRAWSQGVPAMFPRSLKWQASKDAEWDLRQSFFRNGELIISIYLAGCGVTLWFKALG